MPIRQFNEIFANTVPGDGSYPCGVTGCTGRFLHNEAGNSTVVNTVGNVQGNQEVNKGI